MTIVFTYYGYFPITNYIQKRKDHIESNINAAEKANVEAAISMTKATKEFQKAQVEGSKLISESKTIASKQMTDSIIESKFKAKQIMDESMDIIEREKEISKLEVEKHVSDLAILAASKIINENMDTDKNKKMIDEFINELE
ncbi:MAG: ATP synthase F0 subunit B [Tenericutes bacterium]|nr:MAG: ATP synthase F0 subunit B [Mycoplasmatota bacterium]